jgi:hypothetical protein
MTGQTRSVLLGVLPAGHTLFFRRLPGDGRIDVVTGSLAQYRRGGVAQVDVAHAPVRRESSPSSSAVAVAASSTVTTTDRPAVRAISSASPPRTT